MKPKFRTIVIVIGLLAAAVATLCGKGGLLEILLTLKATLHEPLNH